MKLTSSLAGGVALGMDLWPRALAHRRRPRPSDRSPAPPKAALLRNCATSRLRCRPCRPGSTPRTPPARPADAQVQAAQAQAQAAQADVVAAKEQIGDLTTQLQTAQAAIAAIPAPPATTMTWDGAHRFIGNGNTFKFRWPAC